MEDHHLKLHRQKGSKQYKCHRAIGEDRLFMQANDYGVTIERCQAQPKVIEQVEPHVEPSTLRERERERERDLREETVYCSPAWDCGKGSLV